MDSIDVSVIQSPKKLAMLPEVTTVPRTKLELILVALPSQCTTTPNEAMTYVATLLSISWPLLWIPLTAAEATANMKRIMKKELDAEDAEEEEEHEPRTSITSRDTRMKQQHKIVSAAIEKWTNKAGHQGTQAHQDGQ